MRYRTPLKRRWRNWYTWRIKNRIDIWAHRFRAWWPLVYKRDYKKIEALLMTEQRLRHDYEVKLDEVGKAIEVWIPRFSQLYMKRDTDYSRTFSITTTFDERLLYALAYQRERTEALRYFTYRMASMLADKISEVPPDPNSGWQPAPGMMLDERKRRA